MPFYHTPVMLNECLEGLRINPRSVIADCTCGEGGHSEAIAALIPEGRLICVDRDPSILERARERLAGYKNVSFFNGTFDAIAEALEVSGVPSADGILADLGVSMYHFKDGKDAPEGLSYTDERGLDMRIGPGEYSAAAVINRFPEKQIADIIYQYGEETESRRIAKAIVQARPINNAKKLSDVVMSARRSRGGKSHPATRTFQALRIFVNRELEILESFIPLAADKLSAGGRIVIMTYHSLEDRIVKTAFRKLQSDGGYLIKTKKPLVPGDEEVRANRAARSAKLRILERE